MGVDIAVAFLSHAEDPGRLAALAAEEGPDTERIYFVLGRPSAASGGTWFLSLWADGFLSLEGLFQKLSKAGVVCMTWKAEHGGVAGYKIWENGSVRDEASRQGGDYSDLPGKGIEKAFGRKPELSDDDRLFFPEILLDGEVRCYRVGRRTAVAEAAECDAGDLTRLLEGDLDAEPVLPFE